MKIVLERVWERHCSLHPKNPCPWSFGVQDHRKTGSSSSIQKSLQKRFVSLKTTSSSFVEKTLQRKKFFRIEIAMRFIEKRPLRVICKNRCRSASSHRKRPLRGGKNVAEEGVLQDRNRDTFHRKTASSSSMFKSLQKRYVSSKTTSSSSMEKRCRGRSCSGSKSRYVSSKNGLFDQGRNSDFALEFHVEIRFRLFFITKTQ